MAVVSISKIQQRRGRANSGTGLPQLASGELGWAIDTQELYIGNGAVSEGAPAVGNTRILTDKDIAEFNSPVNLFGQLTYIYKASGSISSFTISNGLGYTDGTYSNVPLSWVSFGMQPISLPVANIIVVGGSITSVDLTFTGLGISINAVFSVDNLVLGNGVGFQLFVTDVLNSSGSVITKAVRRPIQSRLDDQVTTLDFGTIGDGVADDTIPLQNAIYEIFLNPPIASSASGIANRLVLDIPAGTYRVTSPIYIPSYATLSGAGIDKTIIVYNPNLTIIGSASNSSTQLNTSSAISAMIGASITGPGIQTGTTILSVDVNNSVTLSSPTTAAQNNQSFAISLIPMGPVIEFVNDESTASLPSDPIYTTYLNQPKNISVNNLTISTEYGAHPVLQLESVRDSNFENIKIDGNWADVFDAQSIAISLNANSALVTCQNNIFKNIVIEGFGYGVYSNKDILNNYFIEGYMSDVRQGFALGLTANGSSVGQQYGPRETKISSYKFYNVKRQAVYIGLGNKNSISDIVLSNVGNDGGNTLSPIYPQVFFNSVGNTLSNISSDRSAVLSPAAVTSKYIPEFAGRGKYVSFGSASFTLTHNTSYASLFKLPVPTNSSGVPSSSINYEIEYTYISSTNSFTRSGTFTLTVDTLNKIFQFVDEYNYAGNEDFNTVLNFRADLLSSSNSVIAINTLTPYGVRISYLNNLSLDSGTFSYSYIAIS